jgi:hypothetical protein
MALFFQRIEQALTPGQGAQAGLALRVRIAAQQT